MYQALSYNHSILALIKYGITETNKELSYALNRVREHKMVDKDSLSERGIIELDNLAQKSIPKYIHITRCVMHLFIYGRLKSNRGAALHHYLTKNNIARVILEGYSHVVLDKIIDWHFADEYVSSNVTVEDPKKVVQSNYLIKNRQYLAKCLLEQDTTLRTYARRKLDSLRLTEEAAITKHSRVAIAKLATDEVLEYDRSTRTLYVRTPNMYRRFKTYYKL